MKNKVLFLVLILAVNLGLTCRVSALDEDYIQSKDSSSISGNEKFVMVWTSGDRDVALKMVFMYTYNAKKFEWWNDITLVVWGPSAKLLTEDEELKDYMASILESGINVIACKACSDKYGVSEELEALGIEVAYIGKTLTDFVKEGRNILTF